MSQQNDPPPSGQDPVLPSSLPKPLLLPAKAAAELIGVSVSAWWGYHAAGLCPRPLKLGSRTMWRRDELLAWVNAGCPPRAEWLSATDRLLRVSPSERK